ncbi:MAG: DUF4013 domain-containing protein [archaeon]
MVNYNEAFKRPFTDIKSLIIGCLLNILPIINFFAIGYILKSTDTLFSKRKNFAMPVWTDWGNLFVKGLVAFVIAIIYMIPALILFAFAAASTGFAAITATDLSTMGLASFGILGIIGMIVSLAMAYIIPSAVLSYQMGGAFGAAFTVNVFKKAFNGAYAIPWIVGMLFTIVLTGVLGFIPVIGSAIAGYIGYVVLLSLLAQDYATF